MGPRGLAAVSLSLVWRFSLTFWFSTCRCRTPPRSPAPMWGLHLECMFSWARDVCSDEAALHLCVIPDSAPRSPNLTQGWASDVGAHSRNCTWPTFLPKISLVAHNVHRERHPGTEPAGSTGSWSCPHSLWGLHPLRGGQRKRHLAGALRPCGWLRTLCTWIAWVRILALPYPSCVSMDKLLDLCVYFFKSVKWESCLPHRLLGRLTEFIYKKCSQQCWHIISFMQLFITSVFSFTCVYLCCSCMLNACKVQLHCQDRVCISVGSLRRKLFFFLRRKHLISSSSRQEASTLCHPCLPCSWFWWP